MHTHNTRSPLRALILAILVLLAVVLFSTTTAQASALASPVGLPMPFLNADYDNRLAPMPHATRPKHSQLRGPTDHSRYAPPKHKRRSVTNSSFVNHVYSSPTSYSAVRASRRDGMDDLLGAFSTSTGSAVTNSQDLQDMASQSDSQENDSTFQQNAVGKLSSFQSNMQASSDILSQLAADKGLANYDKNDQLETVLKDLVNANKNALSAVYVMINNDPTLGPLLGPIVYDIKCLIDKILDATENITDGLLNTFKPLLSGTSANANSITCMSQVKVIGLCLL